MPLNCFLTEKILWSTSMWVLDASQFPIMASSLNFPSNSLIQKTHDLFQTNQPLLAECGDTHPAQIEERKCKEDATLDRMHPINKDRHISSRHISLASIDSENVFFFYTTKTWEEHQKQHHFKIFPGFSPTWPSRCFNTKSSTKSDMVAKSKKYFLLDYKFIISILFISVFSLLLACKTGALQVLC